jgi:hypothetical protein
MIFNFRVCAGFWAQAATAYGRGRHAGVQKPAHVQTSPRSKRPALAPPYLNDDVNLSFR